jgi:hypothetical protein
MMGAAINRAPFSLLLIHANSAKGESQTDLLRA